MVPILCYHKIERRREIGITRLSPRHFARHMIGLAERGWRAVGLETIAAGVQGTHVTGPKEFAITFDDAYRGLREHAFPLLSDLGFPAICAVITDYAGRLNRWDVSVGGRRFGHLAWRDIERWAARGVTFVSHTATHPRLPLMDEARVRRECERSREALTKALGAPPAALVYPWGAAGRREHQIAKETGYGLAFTTATPWSDNAFHIPRIPVYAWHRVPPAGPSFVTSVIQRTNGMAPTCWLPCWLPHPPCER